jgi:SAM-dependent methyltransferase
VTTDNRLSAWDASYSRRENFVFFPGDEVVRFVSRYLRRRVGLDEVIDVRPGASDARVLDIGCGIGRNLLFGQRMGLQMWGIDLSPRAVSTAREWIAREAPAMPADRVVAGDVRALPWSHRFFDHAMADSVFDSMTFDIACAGVLEAARVVKPGGLFYCSLIGDPRGSAVREEIVETTHERDTVQGYFDEAKIRTLAGAAFAVTSCALHGIDDVITGRSSHRWHVVMERR